MAKIVNAWDTGREVKLVVRTPEGGSVIRTMRAPWDFFLRGADDHDRRALLGSRDVVGVRIEGDYTRVQCLSRWARRNLIQSLNDQGVVDSIREGDVSPVKRILADHGSLEIDPAPRLGWFDLETDSRQSFADQRAGKARILAWAARVPIGAGPETTIQSMILGANDDGAEQDLIAGLFRNLRDCDVALAWNGGSFDFDVLKNRAKTLGVEVEWNRWCWLDHMQVYKKYNMHSHESGDEKSSFKLDDVAKVQCGTGKLDFDASKTWDEWSKGGEARAQLRRYNIHDTELLPAIEAKTGYVALHLAVSHICRVPPDTWSLHATAQGDGFLLRLGTLEGYRWPTRDQFGPNHLDPYAGAYVMHPTRVGVVDEVHVVDFASLYPSIMRTFNMSPETLIELGTEDDRNRGIKLPSMPTWFRRDRRGLLPIALDRLTAARSEYSKQQDQHEPGSPAWESLKRLSQGHKIVNNSFYGIVGSPYSRFFSRAVAEGVTKTGEWLIRHVMAEETARGATPFYGDTDSCFCVGDRVAVQGMTDHVNREWPSLLAPFGVERSYIKLEFEKTFRRLLMVSAKRYAATFSVYKGREVAQGTKPEVRGLEYKRGDAIKLARTMQLEIVKLILGAWPGMPEPAAVETWIEGWRERILTGALALDDVVISQSIDRPLDQYGTAFTTDKCTGAGCGYGFGDRLGTGQDRCPRCSQERRRATAPAHVRVARDLAARGLDVQPGTRVRYLFVGEDHQPIDADQPGALDRVSRPHYWTNRVWPPTERVLEACWPNREWRQAKVVNRRVDDLPLFQGTRSEPKPARLRIRTRRAPESEPDQAVIIVPQDRQQKPVYEAIREIARLHPGPTPLVLVLPGIEGATVTIPTGVHIQSGSTLWREIERVLGAGAKSTP